MNRVILIPALAVAFMTCLTAQDMDDCWQACEERVAAFLERCGQVEGEDCDAQAEQIMEQCLASLCEDPPPPPPPSCEILCQQHADEVAMSCHADGGSEEECHRVWEEAFEACLTNECNLPPQDCHALCEEQAEEFFQACLSNGVDEQACWRRREEMFERCLQDACENPPPPPPPPDDCQVICEHQAEEVFHGCLQQGLPEVECWRMREQALEECLRALCDNGSRYALRVAPPEGLSACDPAEVYVQLDTSDPVQAFSFGMLHDPAVLSLTGIDFENCPAVSALNNGAGPDFFDVDTDAGSSSCVNADGNEDGTDNGTGAGGTVYLVASSEAPSVQVIPAGSGTSIARFTYDVAAGVSRGTRSSLQIVGCLGDDLPWPVVLTVDFFSVTPQRIGASFTVRPCAGEFLRGDANHDAKRDVSDAVSILGYLFEEGAGPLECEDAADCNDDGKLNVADPINLLQHLFGGGGPLPEPFEHCGGDPTADELSPCEAFLTCR